MDCCKPFKDEHKREDTADSLTQESRPRHTRNPHFECGHKQDIHADVACGRCRQKDKRRLGIPKRGENARCYIVVEHERQSETVDS